MKKYELCWRAKWSCDGAQTIAEMVEALKRRIEYLEDLDSAGCNLREPISDDYAFIETDDEAVAVRFNLQETDFDDE